MATKKNESTNDTEDYSGLYFGGCPTCRKTDGFLNIGRTHFFVCNTHKVYWCVGGNLFSSWRDEDEDLWEKNKKLLESYSGVECWHPPIETWDNTRVVSAKILTHPKNK